MATTIIIPAAPKRIRAVIWLAARSPTVAIRNMSPRNPDAIAMIPKRIAIQVSALI
jgi:hypothetical protein